MDAELIAVSEGFVKMTGFDREDAVGENCRFLNEGCDMPAEQRQKLCRSVETGSPFVGVLTNRKKSGEKFLNLLDLRGLIIAKNTRSGEDIWVLVAVQQDVTDMARADRPVNHLPLHNQVARRIRMRLVKQLGELGLGSAMSEIKWQGSCDSADPKSRSISRPSGSWCLASSICWKVAENQAIGGALGEPRPQASAAATPSSSSRAPPLRERGELAEPVVGPGAPRQQVAIPQKPTSPPEDDASKEVPVAPPETDRPSVDLEKRREALVSPRLALGVVALLGALLTVRLLRHGKPCRSPR